MSASGVVTATAQELRLGHMSTCGGEPRARRWILAEGAESLEPAELTPVGVDSGARVGLAAAVDSELAGREVEAAGLGAVGAEEVPGSEVAAGALGGSEVAAGAVGVAEAAAAVSLASLVESGVVTRIVSEPRAIWVWLAAGYEWREWAPSVDAALRAACMMPGGEGTRGEGAPGEGARAAGHILFSRGGPEVADQVLHLVARDVVYGQLAPYIASHGGEVNVGEVRDGAVYVTFGGACGHCPLSDVTLHLRIEGALRERFPQLSEVCDATTRARPGLFAGLWGKR